MPNNDPYSGFRFIVEIDGQPLASFDSVSGLDEIENGLAHSVHCENLPDPKGPRRQEYEIIRLSNGRAGSADLYMICAPSRCTCARAVTEQCQHLVGERTLSEHDVRSLLPSMNDVRYSAN